MIRTNSSLTTYGLDVAWVTGIATEHTYFPLHEWCVVSRQPDKGLGCFSFDSRTLGAG